MKKPTSFLFPEEDLEPVEILDVPFISLRFVPFCKEGAAIGGPVGGMDEESATGDLRWAERCDPGAGCITVVGVLREGQRKCPCAEV